MPGAISESRFDNWYAGFTDWAGVFRNEIYFFTETALYRYATPRFYTVDEFPKEYTDLRALSSTPPRGKGLVASQRRRRLHGRRIDVGVDLAAKNRETLLYNQYQAARDNSHRTEPPFAYVLRAARRPEAGLLAQKMIGNGLDVLPVANPASVPMASTIPPAPGSFRWTSHSLLWRKSCSSVRSIPPPQRRNCRRNPPPLRHHRLDVAAPDGRSS